ncbi:MAG: DUF1217 domain-containing protein [Pseudomonadota bacterium]
MSFAPIIPATGVSALRLIDQVGPAQEARFAQTGEVARLADAFREKIVTITSAADLVADRSLLAVALGAFGLEEELGKRAFLRKVLEEGSGSESFSARLADSRFQEFSAAFGFGDLTGPRIVTSTAANEVADRFVTQRFEAAIGENDPALRLALNFRREAAEIANSATADVAGWYQFLGQAPLRSVLEGAFGLSSSFSQLDLDRQITILSERTQALTGSGNPSTFQDPANVELLLERFMALESSTSAGSSVTSPALTLLQAASGGAAQWSLLLSNAVKV